MASAGHPPPLLRGPDMKVHRLDGGRSLPIGASPDTRYDEVEVDIEAGSLLLLYTDGLVERRDQPIDVGIDRLAAQLGDRSASVADIADSIVKDLSDEHRMDDVVVIALAVEAISQPRLRLRLQIDPRSLSPMRAELRAWLSEIEADDDEVLDILVAE